MVVVTTQSGIARGYFSEDDVRTLHDWMREACARRRGTIDAFYFCPHHPTEGEARYRVTCGCRKPKPGMLLRAAEDLDIDLGRSFLVGDKETDIAAAKAAGVAGHLFRGPNLNEFLTEIGLTEIGQTETGSP